MYFDGNESKSHKKAKEKLFDLIVSKRVRIYDQNGIQYQLFNGEHDDEFLHVESFVMDYDSKVLFSNRESPCINHFEKLKRSTPHCDQNGYFGAYKELPCEKCIFSNFKNQLKYSSELASYRPDIAFGYSGEHKIWLEIENSNPCSKNKIEFCKNKGIILLEIKDTDILNIGYTGDLIFNKLETYVDKVNVFDEISKLIEYIKQKVESDGFVSHSEITNMLINKIGELEFTKQLRHFNKIHNELNDYILVIPYNKDLRKKLNYKGKSNSIWIKMDLLFDTVSLKEQIDIMFNSIKNDMVDKYYHTGKFAKLVEERSPKEIKDKYSLKKLYTKYGFVSINVKDNIHKLIDCDIIPKGKVKRIIVHNFNLKH